MEGFLETVLRLFPKKNFFIIERSQEEIMHMKIRDNWLVVE